MDIFEKLKAKQTPLGKYQTVGDGYFMFPKLEGEIKPRMSFRGREVLTWSLNNYIGLANDPEVRKADEDGAKEWGLAYPMGARIMSGQTEMHEELENRLAQFVGKEKAYLLNYGYQGMVSIIDSLVDRNDVIVYDSESHACILDGLRLHLGKRFVYPHNDLKNLDKELERATKITEKTKGGILIITEGVFGMSGDLGKLNEINKLKEKYDFRMLVDDAHGFGTMGNTGAGTGEHLNVQDGVDIYFGTFAKSMAGIGAFVASDKAIVDMLRFSMRSQIFAKSLPMPMVVGALKRLELLQNKPELRNKLWDVVNALQNGLREKGFNIGNTESPVTPVFFSGNVAQGTNVLIDLRENYSIFCSIVVYPVVPKGVIMLRLIPTAEHTLEDVEYTINAFAEIKEKLEKGHYNAEEVTGIEEISKG
ncbi:MAG: pyridoxal phosphate-dependent aminotransferase family protein [Bacteroidetes bacterium]|nr:pyridoxal phosphate-dependent aminotransferase family protein [Bacteroidota bacterium]MBT6685672.1 pyridoxal phosphate-dependent aminotransferase family protein [Bacteroidota bacterium]MBT7141896.1 pyridoxal phosphate-dependent aminotransferase family protein [Bacteroidota bacterium]MBT7491027.1 pyridoxal phosphate-dependent aminotransferase family protein [Bacteroidota bacterium]